MYSVEKTTTFDRWLTKLKDRTAKAKILLRIKKAETGNLGTSRSLGSGISELKIDYGPGYRLYYTRRKQTIIWLLCGGDKSTQQTDIVKAKKILAELEK